MLSDLIWNRVEVFVLLGALIPLGLIGKYVDGKKHEQDSAKQLEDAMKEFSTEAHND
jgi:hypothetical protein